MKLLASYCEVPWKFGAGSCWLLGWWFFMWGAGGLCWVLWGLVRFIYIWDSVVASKLEELFDCGQSQLILVLCPLLHAGLS